MKSHFTKKGREIIFGCPDNEGHCTMFYQDGNKLFCEKCKKDITKEAKPYIK